MILLYKHYRRLQFLLAGMQFYALGLQNCLRLYRLYSGFIAFSISEGKGNRTDPIVIKLRIILFLNVKN